MTVSQLIKHLSQFPPEMPVIQSRDADGNGFSFTQQIDTVDYWPGEGEDSEIWWRENPQDDPPAEFKPVVCIWPAL